MYYPVCMIIAENPLRGGIWKNFFMESISIIKGATTMKKEAKKVQRQKRFCFDQIQHAFIQCTVK